MTELVKGKINKHVSYSVKCTECAGHESMKTNVKREFELYLWRRNWTLRDGAWYHGDCAPKKRMAGIPGGRK